MPLTNQTSLGPIFGLTQEQSDYAMELVYHGAAGAWIAQGDPLMPLMKALLNDPARLSKVQQFCVLHAMLSKACDDWEAPTLTGQSADFARAALVCLQLDTPLGNVQAIDHVQIAIPVGGEAIAHKFYGELLGLTQVPKPPAMAARGGAWYQNGHVKVHLGVEVDFRANDKAHVAFVVDDVAALVMRAAAAGFAVKQDDELPGYVRAFLYDPFGNRVEVLRAAQAV